MRLAGSFGVASGAPALRIAAAAAVVSLLSIGSASAATFTLSGTAEPGPHTLNSNFDPIVSAAMAAQMVTDGIHAGTAITVYDPTHTGGLFVAPQSVNISFQFIGHEASFVDTAWLLAFGNSVIFNNQTSHSGDISGPLLFNVGSNPGGVPFQFQAPGGLNAINGGTIASGLKLAFAQVSSTVAYAFFDDGGAGPDSDFDDIVLRITASDPAGGGPGPTPIPAALPLFATGLGALGLLGWRRKRKAVAVPA